MLNFWWWLSAIHQSFSYTSDSRKCGMVRYILKFTLNLFILSLYTTLGLFKTFQALEHTSLGFNLHYHFKLLTYHFFRTTYLTSSVAYICSLLLRFVSFLRYWKSQKINKNIWLLLFIHTIIVSNKLDKFSFFSIWINSPLTSLYSCFFWCFQKINMLFVFAHCAFVPWREIYPRWW